MTSLTISEPPTARTMWNDVRGRAEPAAAFVAFVALVWQMPRVAAEFSGPSGWSASALYGGVFSWASIQAGFLFAVYTFIVPRSEPFVKAVAATVHFKAFKQYMLSTTYLTFAVAIAAFGLTVVNPTPPASGVGSVLLAAWLSTFGLSFLGFLKVIRSFRKLDRRRE